MTGDTPDAAYFSQPRHDVLNLVPADAKRVLDVGCGFGALGRLLVSERRCTVHGIERNASAAGHLAGVYERHAIGDIENAVGAFSNERYDCIIFADVLEHLIDPWATVTRFCGLLAPGGSVVASIPNVRNFALLFDVMVRGRWRYADSGLLDRTHLRFFTRREIEVMFERAELAIEVIRVNRDRYQGLARIAVAVPALFAPDLAVCQFLVRARPIPRRS